MYTFIIPIKYLSAYEVSSKFETYVINVSDKSIENMTEH